jgi:ribose transport system ATP-binding protein
MAEDDIILKVTGISKRFGGLQALSDVDMEVRRSEVHALVGENGAGKSTLMKILGGIEQKDSGKIIFENSESNFANPRESQKAGIAIIHQELSMLPTLNVIENVYMGRMVTRGARIDWKEMERMTREQLAKVGLSINPYTEVKSLSMSQRQLVEIAKALSVNAKLIIMDEPNSSLCEAESERLFCVIDDLRRKGISVIYVSHKIGEVIRISQRISVLKDGRFVGTIGKDEATADKVIQMMVGRELSRVHIDRTGSGKVRLDVRGLTSASFTDVSFDLREGEILGFSGLVGAGRTEVARAIFGADPYVSGEILLEGNKVSFGSPNEAIKSGIAMVAEDRKTQSLFPELSIAMNMCIAELPRLKSGIRVKDADIIGLVSDYRERLSIKMKSEAAPVKSLSGGNQQKTILGRWLATRPKILILDEPTHGIDVGAKAEIYKLIRDLASGGMSIILISSELPEIISMSDRVVVMHEGRITGILPWNELTEEKIMSCATGNELISSCAG